MIVEGNGEAQELKGIQREIDLSLRMRIDFLQLEIQTLRKQLDIGKNFSELEKSGKLTFHIVGRASWGWIFESCRDYEFKGEGRLKDRIVTSLNNLRRYKSKKNYQEEISVWLILEDVYGKEVAISISDPCWREYCQL